jgi:hypothetical protein
VTDDFEQQKSRALEALLSASGPVSWQATFKVLALYGRNAAPQILVMLDAAGRLHGPDMGRVLLEAWQVAEWPMRALPRRSWLEWFQRAGFTSYKTPRPPAPVTLYRAQVGRTIGMSWTTELDQAIWFHGRNGRYGFSDARLLRATVAPVRILGIVDGGRDESEVIVNPQRLKSKPLSITDADQTRADAEHQRRRQVTLKTQQP